MWGIGRSGSSQAGVGDGIPPSHVCAPDPDPASDVNPESVAAVVARADRVPVTPRQGLSVDGLLPLSVFDGDATSFVPFAVWLLSQCNRSLEDTIVIADEGTTSQVVMQGTPVLARPVSTPAAARPPPPGSPTASRAPPPSKQASVRAIAVPSSQQPVSPPRTKVVLASRHWLILWRQELVLYLRLAVTMPMNARAFGRYHGFEAVFPLFLVPASAASESSGEAEGATDGFVVPHDDPLVGCDPDGGLAAVFPKGVVGMLLLARACVHVVVASFESYSGNCERFKREDILQVLVLSLLQVGGGLGGVVAACVSGLHSSSLGAPQASRHPRLVTGICGLLCRLLPFMVHELSALQSYGLLECLLLTADVGPTGQTRQLLKMDRVRTCFLAR